MASPSKEEGKKKKDKRKTNRKRKEELCFKGVWAGGWTWR